MASYGKLPLAMESYRKATFGNLKLWKAVCGSGRLWKAMIGSVEEVRWKCNGSFAEIGSLFKPTSFHMVAEAVGGSPGAQA